MENYAGYTWAKARIYPVFSIIKVVAGFRCHVSRTAQEGREMETGDQVIKWRYIYNPKCMPPKGQEG